MMKSVNSIVKKLSGGLGSGEQFLDSMLNGPYVYGLIVLIIGMYGPRLSPRLPRSVRNLFNNSFFRFAVLTLVVYLSNKNLYLALTVSISFVLLLNLANSLEVEEHFVKKYAENFSEVGAVLTEEFEDEKEDKPKKEDEPKKEVDDFGSASYRKGYEDGQEAQCPISSMGGTAYSELEEDKPSKN